MNRNDWQAGRLFQVDSFTDSPFRGNPAGVVFTDGSESDSWMQDMACEMNLSETAFVSPGRECYRIRYFTPTVEVPLCGHATLASAHCALVPLWHGKTGKREFLSRQLSRRSGELRTRLRGDRVEIRGRAVTIFEGRLRGQSR